MEQSLKTTGYLTVDELRRHNLLPDESRFREGPVAVVECVQEIPCNPCESACKFGAIAIGDSITALPRLDAAKCTGCGLCIAQCSGLAIFVVDKTYGESTATVSFPHEYLPLPVKGQVVRGVNRRGEVVCDGKVIRVLNPQANDRTPVVTLEIPRELADEVRGMQRLGPEGSYAGEEPHVCSCVARGGDEEGDDMIVCRCEEVSLGEIKKAVARGASDLIGVKRRTRAGMGLCQGRTCSKIVSRIVAQECGLPLESIEPDRARPPIKPVEFTVYGMIDND